MKRIIARFYCNASGNEPVRDWLKDLSKEDKQIIGVDIQKIEFDGRLVCLLVRH